MSKLLQAFSRHRWATALVAVAFAAAVVVAGLLYIESKKSKLTVGPGAAAEPEPPEPPEPKPSSFVWPTYGFERTRTHNVASRLKPPFKTIWKIRPTGELLEFPPSLARGRLYVVENEGRVFAISAKTGRKIWKRDLGKLAASTPAYADGKLYVTILAGDSEGEGRVASLSARTGRILWSRDLPSRTESSPLVVRDKVFFGAENGAVYALRTGSGSVAWKYEAADAVKSALAYEKGRLYFGDYSGSVQSVRARDGELVWKRTNVSSENFYGTPAIAYGRVYLSTTLGELFALRLNGNVDWRFRAGPQGYFYSSPAVAKPRGGGPTVYIGSQDTKFYALDARTGRKRWAKQTAGRMSGTATILGDYVYYSTLYGRVTYVARARDGKVVWRKSQGAFNPAIADAERVYLIGYSTITALEPKKTGGARGGDKRGGRTRREGDRRASRSARERARDRRRSARKRDRRS